MSDKTAKSVLFLYPEGEKIYSIGRKIRETKGGGSPCEVTIAKLPCYFTLVVTAVVE